MRYKVCELYDILDCLGGTLDNVVYAITGE